MMRRLLLLAAVLSWPTWAQTPFPNKPVKIIVGFYGVLAPAATPKPVLDKLAAAFKGALETPDIRTRMVAQGADPAYLGPEAFAGYLAAETPKWAKAVKDSGAKLD
jgi:tripartite-type tricarboxylate transporter receptor subunit TctC